MRPCPSQPPTRGGFGLTVTDESLPQTGLQSFVNEAHEKDLPI